MRADVIAGVRNEAGLTALLPALAARFGERCQTGEAVCAHHAHTTTYLPAQVPDAVVFVDSRDDVIDAVRLAARHRVPLIPFGTGSSLEGQVNAPFGGISLDFSGMNRLLSVNPADLDCTVEPGMTREALNVALRDTGLFFPIDPGANASIGGMTSTRASGTNAVRYGTMKDNVLALTVVNARGEEIRTARRAKKSSAGYDMTRLYVGAEGTLGIITSVTLRLQGIPDVISGGVCHFPDMEAACNAVITTIQLGIPVARIELLDAMQVRACNAYSGLTHVEAPTLFVEFHGSGTSVDLQTGEFASVVAEFGGSPFVSTSDAARRAILWKARHNAYHAARALAPHLDAVSTDVCVPISRLAECVTATQEDIRAHGFLAPIVGHAGDGNFHVLLLFDGQSAAEVDRAEAFLQRLNERALALDGTCTGEHGIGQGKKSFIGAELGETVAMMRMIKQALDPDGIFNPGKIF